MRRPAHGTDYLALLRLTLVCVVCAAVVVAVILIVLLLAGGTHG